MTRIVSFFLVFCGYWLLGRIGVRNILVYYLLPSVYLASIIYLFAESPAQKLFLFFTVWAYSSFVSAICAWVAAALSGNGQGLPLRYALYGGSQLVLVPLYLIYARSRVKELLALLEKGNPVYAAYPAMAFVLFTVLFGPVNPATSPLHFATMLLFATFLAFSYYLLFTHFHAIYGRMRAESDMENTRQHAMLQRKYYEQFELGVRRQRELLHDARHHLMAIASLHASGKSRVIGRYVKELLDSEDQPAPRRFCENDVANAVIGGYIRLAEQQGVPVFTDIDLPEAMGIDDYELCTVFGNTIENAIEACQRIPEASPMCQKRFINIKSRYEKNRLVMRIENSYANDLDRHDGFFASSKGSTGGIGLRSARSVVERYNGYLSLEPGDGVFRVSAIMYPRSPVPGP